MPLSWNEIKTRAIAFINEWKDEESEDAEAKYLTPGPSPKGEGSKSTLPAGFKGSQHYATGIGKSAPNIG